MYPILKRNREQLIDRENLAWTNYWNHKIAAGFFSRNPRIMPNINTNMRIRPNVVKAVLNTESNFGTRHNPDMPLRMNGEIDIMQTLYPGDPEFWMLALMNPNVEGVYHISPNNNRVIWVRMADGSISWAIIWHRNQSDDIFQRFSSANVVGSGWLAASAISTQTNGQFLYDYNKITQRMSIAFGVYQLAIRTIQEHGNEQRGISRYNANSSVDQVGKVNRCLRHMNATVLQNSVNTTI
jgi:hypothetical protein